MVTDRPINYTHDGLAYCAVCGEALEKIIEVGDERLKFPAICSCQQKEIEEQEQRHRELTHKQAIADLKTSGIRHQRLIQSTFDKDEHPESQASNLCRNFVAQWPEMKKLNIGLILAGSVGTGKTFYAACIANALTDKGISVYMAKFSEILDRILTWNEADVIGDICNHDLVILDDYGSERGTEFSSEQLLNLIDQRYNSDMPLIVTTNKSLADMTQEEGYTGLVQARINGRIMEMCPIEVSCVGSSKRETKRAEKIEQLKAGDKKQ